MLTRSVEGAAESRLGPRVGRGRLARARSIGWLGQTAASLCWIGSMLSYGIDSGGDWLQLCAATAWLLANIATLVTHLDD